MNMQNIIASLPLQLDADGKISIQNSSGLAARYRQLAHALTPDNSSDE